MSDNDGADIVGTRIRQQMMVGNPFKHWCPECQKQIDLEISGGKRFFKKHNNPEGEICSFSDKKVK